MNPLPDRLFAAGIDVGSSSVKAVVIEESAGQPARRLAGRAERIRRRDPHEVAEATFAGLLAEIGLHREDLTYIATTGEGESLEDRTGHFYGMTAHARGGREIDPEATAILDVGALHARAVLIDPRAKVLGYRMTSQCASGSGQFLENISRYLGVTMAEIGPLSLQARAPEACSSICAVLAETDVINMVSRGISTPDIIKGIHQSMAGRFLRLLVAAGARHAVLVTGGLAADVGLIAALREEAESLGRGKGPTEIRAHPDSILAGALGAALWGAFRARKLASRGVALGRGPASPSLEARP